MSSKIGENGEPDGWKVTVSYEGPSRKMSKVDSWIESELDEKIEKTAPPASSACEIALNEALQSEEFMKDFTRSFSQKKPMKLKKMKLLNEPFQAAVVKNFLSNESVVAKLVEEIEQLDWTRKQMDLYEFYQTADLANISSPYLSKFYNFINDNVRCWMENLTGMKFQRVSASCSMYNCGDFLLSHDDLLSDRLVAYVFYLSPWENKKTWNEAMGGALELFASDGDGQPKFPAVEKISPSSNQLAFFKVEKRSHHQVAEVLTKDYPRLTINGWFHGPADNVDYDADAVKIKKPNVPIFKSPTLAGDSSQIEAMVNRNYLKKSIKKEIQKQIEENSEAGLGEFLKSDVLGEIESELKGSKLKWILKGPANQQNFEILDATSLPKNSHLTKFIDLVGSKQFFKLLYDYTELDLHEKDAKNPKYTVEFQRWKGGCYTLINDPSTYNYDCLDLLFFIGSNDGIGTTTFLTPEGKQENESVMSSEIENGDDDDSVLLTIYPQNNFLNLVYRSSGTTKFVKYCYKSTVMESEFNYILSCSYKE
jgi:Rps23 Pro-64 3,4-dihydroxylase Tpa1-like proline 4-hydroxylase